MKNVSLAFLSIMGCFSERSFANQPNIKQNAYVRSTDERKTFKNSNTNYEKTFNIKTNPIGLIFNMMSVTGEYQIDEAITIGPQIGLLNWSNYGYSITGFGVGARAKFTFNEKSYDDAFYVSPGVMVQHVSVESNGYFDDYLYRKGEKLSYTIFQLHGSAGYQWFWDKGFNMNVGGGFGYSAGNANRWSFISGIHPHIEYEIGYAF